MEKRRLGTKINKIYFDLSTLQNNIQELKSLKVRIEGVNEKKVRIAELEKSNEPLQKDIELLEQHAISL